jgi:diguanylate cyclase (GGDEF)-like protein
MATTLASYMVSVTLLKKGLTESILPLTGDNIYSEIQKDLTRPIFISSMMATDTFLRDWVLAGEKDVNQLTKYLSEIKTKYQTITSFFVSERSLAYYHADGILKQVHIDDPRDSWYFRVRSMKIPYELNVDKDMANHDAMTIFINHRVYDYDGNYLGATGCGLSVTAVSQLLKNYEERYRRHIFFMNQQGVVTFSADNRYEQRSIGDIEGLKELSATIFNQGSGSFSYKRDDQTFLLDTRFLPEIGWYLLVEQSLDEETNLLRKTLLINLALCFIISLIILVAVQRTVSYYQQRLELMATTDKVTGLNNRHAGETLFAQAIRETFREQGKLSIILFDIDHFKRINDEHGHLAGDAVLASIAETVHSCLREADSITRWGGEEFLVILKDCEIEDAFQIAEKIRLSVAAKAVVFQNTTIFANISLGTAQWQTDESGETLLMRADNAMYKAKSNGRNRTVRSGN